MTNKKILNFIPNFSFGGVETTNINLSETLIKFGYEVDLVTNDYQRVNKSEDFFYDYSSEVNNIQNIYYKFGIKNLLLRIYKLLKLYKINDKFRK